MATDLFTPILNDRTRAPYFFNGRLLTGETMTAEQRAQQTAHELLARGLGDGVADGLQVLLSKDFNTVDTPVVTVRAGTAISRRGDLLYLAEDAEIQLVRPTSASAATQKRIFEACSPPQKGTYVTDSGIYLLTIAPITVGDQLAPVSGLGSSGSCNVKYRVNAVEFRLVELGVPSSVFLDANRLRNAVAYACFGIERFGTFARDPFGSLEHAPTVVEDLRGKTLTDCDVPLAVLHWTATGGIRFLDQWSVRRRVTKTRSAADYPTLTDARLAVAEAMLQQFVEHLDALRRQTPFGLTTVQARTHFRWLPPAGLVPIASGGADGFDVDAFFTGKTWNEHSGWTWPIYTEGGVFETLLRDSAKYLPVDLDDPEMVWLYWVHENMRALHTGHAVTPYVIFTNAHLPFAGDPRLDRSHFSYANFL